MEVQGGRCQPLRPGASGERRLRSGAEAGQGCMVHGEVRVSPPRPGWLLQMAHGVEPDGLVPLKVGDAGGPCWGPPGGAWCP